MPTFYFDLFCFRSYCHVRYLAISLRIATWTLKQLHDFQNANETTVKNKGKVNSLRPSDAYLCVSKLAISGPDNGLSPGRRQAIIWTNDGILSIGPLGQTSVKS